MGDIIIAYCGTATHLLHHMRTVLSDAAADFTMKVHCRGILKDRITQAATLSVAFSPNTYRAQTMGMPSSMHMVSN